MRMFAYISMLRGINVSGQKIVKMADLKMLYENLGFKDVVTYIQSGNVIFKYNKIPTETLSKKITDALKAQYGFTVPITIRTYDDMQKLVSSNPFLTRKNIDLSKLHVTFLGARPTAAQIISIKSVDSKGDELSVSGSEIYLYCPGGYGRTKLSNNFFESKLKQPATTRNWKTVNKLYQMSLSS